VWLYFWRAGCPVCRQGIERIEKLHRKFVDEGLVILGFNSSDEKDIALGFMREAGITFPNILDTSDEAIRVEYYAYRSHGAPVNYIIDRDGNIVDAWNGDYKTHDRALAALKEIGGPLADAMRQGAAASE
jgi:peroxiredoxin